ncbi:MAG TPA: transglutaminase family protein, partial [Casimicrobiaceae bacterium]|nr:transglutaminase family protein [Casimicrobiaceae bacterium]
MPIRVALAHRTTYRYDRPVNLSAHEIRLRPAPHCRTPILGYSLSVTPEKHFLNWQQDPYGNWIARAVFPSPTQRLEVTVDLTADLAVINPFDFFVEPYAETFPFVYSPTLAGELAPFLDPQLASPRLDAWVERLRAHVPPQLATVELLVLINQRVKEDVAYLVRMEPGVQTPDETLGKASGSCRDSGWLLVQVLRRLGIAARFASGYLIQLAADVKPLEGPAGVDRDFTDLHAWAEAYVPGAGWIGLDPTSGLFAGEGHLPLACTASPGSAAPITGLADFANVDFGFAMSVTRMREDPRVTRPYSDAQWSAIDALGERVDAELRHDGVRLTQGGEPTFVALDDGDDPEWNFTALSPRKRELAETLLRRLKARFAPGGLLHLGQGKWYPGESLPRWAIGVFWRVDGAPLWRDETLVADLRTPDSASAAVARRFIDALADRLALPRDRVIAAREHGARRSDDPAGFVLPLAPRESDGTGGGWQSAAWPLASGRVDAIAGDSPLGLRLPLASLPDDVRVRTAVTIEVRNGHVAVFVPPLERVDDYARLIATIEDTARATATPVAIEGYPPPRDPALRALLVTPDPGVIEVNIHPAASWGELVDTTQALYEEARLARLATEKFMLDGRHAGTGGGNHVTLGGATPADSP